jgi:hypothetical protein
MVHVVQYNEHLWRVTETGDRDADGTIDSRTASTMGPNGEIIRTEIDHVPWPLLGRDQGNMILADRRVEFALLLQPTSSSGLLTL